MGKSIITARMSADASIGPSIGWYKPDGEHEAAGEDEVRLADAMLLGRKTYEALAPIWMASTGAFADMVNSIPKYVASTSLTGPLEWNATLIKGHLVEGARPFHGLGHIRMRLKDSTVFRNGVVRQRYEPVLVDT